MFSRLLSVVFGVFTLGFSALFAHGQPLEKDWRNTALWAETQLLVKNSQQHLWFSELQVRYSTLPDNQNTIAEAFPFYRAHLWVGRQWHFSEAWQGSLSGRVALENNRQLLFSTLYAQHSGSLGRFKLVKRLQWEHLTDSQETPLYWARTSGWLWLSTSFQRRAFAWKPILSYQFFFNHRTADNPIPAENERLIDRTRLRFDLTLCTAAWRVGVFAMRETDYFFAQEVFDENGEMKKPFRKLNLITPTYGISFRYIWEK